MVGLLDVCNKHFKSYLNTFIWNEKRKAVILVLKNGQVAQSVEQRTENPCVGGSIPSLPTPSNAKITESSHFFC